MTLATPTCRKHLSGVMLGLSLETRLPNLKFVPSVVFRLLAFNAQKFMGSRDVTTATSRKHLSGVMSGVSLKTRLPNLKFVASAVLELLAFNAQTFTGSRNRDHAHLFGNICQGSCGDYPWEHACQI